MLNTSNPDWTTTVQLGDQATPVTPTSKYAQCKEREGAPPKAFYMSQPPMLDLLPLQLQNGCCGNSWDKSEVPSSLYAFELVFLFLLYGSNTKQQYLGVGL